MTDNDIRQAVTEKFARFDVNRSGYLEWQELRELLKDVFKELSVPRDPSEEDYRIVLAKMDKNSDGKISKEELFSAMKEFLGQAY